MKEYGERDDAESEVWHMKTKACPLVHGGGM